jgi:hypothetical protein
MAQLINFEGVKSYASRENAVKAFQKKYGDADVRFLVIQNLEGRFLPVAIGQEAVQLGVHFNFAVAG